MEPPSAGTAPLTTANALQGTRERCGSEQLGDDANRAMSL